jgi:hypothetical protein
MDSPEKTKAPKAAPSPKAAQDLRKEAIAAFHEADTREKKAAVVEKYPLLKHVYSEANYS